MKQRLHTFTITAAVLSAALVMSACGGKTKETSTVATGTESAAAGGSSTASSGASAAAGGSSSAAATGERGMISAAKDAKLGDIVVDANGLTLYRFDKDTGKPSKTNCTAACTDSWPPLIATSTPKVAGIDVKLIGSTKRPDGTEQVTINGWPAYVFSGDKAAGDTNGQGVGGVWFAFTPTGEKAGGGSAAPAGSSSSAVSKSASSGY
jgi:predicted lipoprotein with Yx(FWY)xxD motif